MKPVWPVAVVLLLLAGLARGQDVPLRVGFAEADLSPDWTRPVYLAGFGKNRKATGQLDPIMVRAVVLEHGKERWALVSVDLVGLFLPTVEKVRRRLSEFTHVTVSCTHNHHGPDTLGLWGPSLFESGVDRAYLAKVQEGIVRCVRDAERSLRSAARAHLGEVKAPQLLHDSRLPLVKHDDLVVLRWEDAKAEPLGILVQWNCHPETLDSKNPKVSADYVGHAVEALKRRHGCPVVYFTGTVGGLMTSINVNLKDERGEPLPRGSEALTKKYGQALAEEASRALAEAKEIRLTPLRAWRRALFLPLDNPAYLVGYQLGVLERTAHAWTGDSSKGGPVDSKNPPQKMCVETEIGYLRLGDLHVACIPGEIYPELVLGKVQDPADPAADYPNAAIEPAIYPQMPAPRRMIFGLANDELGYIIPKRQWDASAPFCYGRTTSQYGEINSLGVETAPLLCEAFRSLAKEANK
jgi:hypothetical protein